MFSYIILYQLWNKNVWNKGPRVRIHGRETENEKKTQKQQRHNLVGGKKFECQAEHIKAVLLVVAFTAFTQTTLLLILIFSRRTCEQLLILINICSSWVFFSFFIFYYTWRGSRESTHLHCCAQFYNGHVEYDVCRLVKRKTLSTNAHANGCWRHPYVSWFWGNWGWRVQCGKSYSLSCRAFNGAATGL